MSPMIPDCGVLTTPRRDPPVKLNLNGSFSSPKMASIPYKSPIYSSDSANVTLSTGFSFSFYKTAKSPVTPVRRVSEPEPVKRRAGKRYRDSINKGVSHKIKKPKTKSKEMKKKTRSMKTTIKNLRDGNFTPTHWTPANRSPVKKTSKTGVKKKRHVLASPGVSFLDEEIFQEETDDAGGRKFFTSRSRASARVIISKNVMLAKKNGDISLKQRDALFEKKNVGRVIEDELDKFIQTSSVTESMPSSLPSVKANPRPLPTRVTLTPSPPKRLASPKKGKKLFNPKSLKLSSSEPPQLKDLQPLLSHGKNCKSAELVPVSSQNDVTLRRSPRKHAESLTPKKSPNKESRFSSPVRRSPRYCGSPTKSPICSPLPETDRVTSEKLSVQRCSTELNFTESEVCETSPRKKLLNKIISEETVEKELQLVDQNKVMLKDSSKVCELGESENNNNTSKAASNSPKLFPLFDRQNWRPSGSSPKKNKTCLNHPSYRKSGDSQMIIDAGQKDYGTRQCGDCGLVYEIANQEDEANHWAHHNSRQSSLKYNGWKNENLVRELDELGGRVVMISSKDPLHFWRKVEEVLTVVDNELGFSEVSHLVKENSRAFMYILDRQVVGFLVGERIKKANRVIPPKSTALSTTRLLCCSQEQVTVWAGVSRLWVLADHRGKGIAAKLCEAMLCYMFSHHILSREEIAFSDPTESGTKFAEKFTGRRDFLVYRR